VNKLHEGDDKHEELKNNSMMLKDSSVLTMGTAGDDPSASDAAGLFKPKISSYSYKLAERKEKKDLQLLSELIPSFSHLQSQTIDTQEQEEDQHTGHHQHTKDGRAFSVDMSQITGDDLDNSYQQLQSPSDVNSKLSPSSTFRPVPRTQSSNKLEKSSSMTSISGTSVGNLSFSSKQDRLVAQALLIQKKREKLVFDTRKKQLEGCTFRPEREAKNYRIKKQQRDKKESSRVVERNVVEDLGEEELDGEADEELDESAYQDEEFHDAAGDNHEEIELAFQTDKNRNLEGNEIQLPESEPGNQQVPPAGKKAAVAVKKDERKEEEESSVYDRLYSLKDKKPKALTEIQPTYLQELQSCTFKPEIPKHHKNLALLKAKMQSQVLSSHETNKSIEKTVERMRKTIQKREEKKYEESDENVRKRAEEKYQKSREKAKQGFLPFHFQSEERINYQEKRKIRKNHPIDSKSEVKDKDHKSE
jgi:hypothetical protein